jgi:hypothetical protein
MECYTQERKTTCILMMTSEALYLVAVDTKINMIEPLKLKLVDQFIMPSDPEIYALAIKTSTPVIDQ